MAVSQAVECYSSEDSGRPFRAVSQARITEIMELVQKGSLTASEAGKLLAEATMPSVEVVCYSSEDGKDGSRAIGLLGMRRFPVVLHAGEWEQLLSDKIREQVLGFVKKYREYLPDGKKGHKKPIPRELIGDKDSGRPFRVAAEKKKETAS